MDIVPLSDVSARNNEVTAGGGDGTKQLKKRKNVTFVRILYLVMIVLSHIFMLVFTIFVMFVSFGNYTFFSWHPALMALGALLLMGEAVVAMSSESVLAQSFGRQTRVRIHWILQAAATMCIFLGFAVIVINKSNHKKEHFKTPHGILGLISVILVGLTSTGGVLSLFSMAFKNVITPAKTKLIHNVFGVITFSAGLLSIILGMYSKWFVNNTNFTTRVMFTILLLMTAALVLKSSLKSAYSRAKTSQSLAF